VTAKARDEEPLHPWFADRHRSLCHGLSQFLEPDAGLREATFHTGHVNLLADLGSHLDTRAGLAAVIAPLGSAIPPSPLTVAAAIAAVDPAVRLALRRHPAILTVILSDYTAWALTIASGIPVEWNPYGDLDRARTALQDFGMAYNLDLDRLLDFDRGLTHDRHRGLARGLADARELAQDLDFGRSRAACGRAVALVHELTRANVLAADLAAARSRGLDNDSGTEADLAVSLDLARYVARQTALTVSRALGIGQAEGLAATLLDGALDDFIYDDLTNVDLTHRDLTGVRWSDNGTSWPPGTDVDELRARSRELGSDTGIYVIVRPDDTGKALPIYVSA
jgi:hypothetical protein